MWQWQHIELCAPHGVCNIIEIGSPDKHTWWLLNDMLMPKPYACISVCVEHPECIRKIICCTCNKSKMPGQQLADVMKNYKMRDCTLHTTAPTATNPYVKFCSILSSLIISVPIEICRPAFCTLTLLFLVIMPSHFNIQYVILLFDPIKTKCFWLAHKTHPIIQILYIPPTLVASPAWMHFLISRSIFITFYWWYRHLLSVYRPDEAI